MPLKTGEEWEDQIIALKVNNPKWGAGRILHELEAGPAHAEVPYLGPSEPTIRRIIKRRLDVMTEHARNQYRYLYWPESFERNELPWEAARPLLDLLAAELHENRPRPTLRVCTWYWRLCQAVPDFEPLRLVGIAKQFAVAEVGGTSKEKVARVAEGWLAFAPWTNEGINPYREAIRNNIIPNPDDAEGIDFSNEETAARVREELGIRRKENSSESEGG